MRIIPVPRYESETRSETVRLKDNACSTYDYNASQLRGVRFPSPTQQGMSSFHQQHCSLSKWYLPRLPWGGVLPVHRKVLLASIGGHIRLNVQGGCRQVVSSVLQHNRNIHLQQPKSLVENTTWNKDPRSDGLNWVNLR